MTDLTQYRLRFEAALYNVEVEKQRMAAIGAEIRTAKRNGAYVSVPIEVMERHAAAIARVQAEQDAAHAIVLEAFASNSRNVD